MFTVRQHARGNIALSVQVDSLEHLVRLCGYVLHLVHFAEQIKTDSLAWKGWPIGYFEKPSSD